MKSVFIDGHSGTTGLQIGARLAEHDDVEVLSIDDSQRKNELARQKCFEAADLVILCLPDAAARKAVKLAAGSRVLDASSAHRVAPGWTYGLPELTASQRSTIASAPLVSNPGCYPTAFLLLTRPLIDADILPAEVPLRSHAVSGYSGGGKSLIEKYRQHDTESWQTRPYSLDLRHKHVPEMHSYSGTLQEPLLVAVVGHFCQGMLVHVPIFHSELPLSSTRERIHAVLVERYSNEPSVRVLPLGAVDALEDGFLSPTRCNDTDLIELMVFGNDAHILLTARLDNLGKGAAGAAVQNMNLMLGFDESAGLRLSTEFP